MADLLPRNMAAVRTGNFSPQQLGECISDIVSSHNYVAQQVNASPVGQTPAPTAPSRLTVTGGAGIIHASIADTSEAYRGNEYHMEVMPHGGNWATDAHPISLGPSRAYRGMLGSGTYEARVCTGYNTSNPSPWTYSGKIDATGTTPPPFPQNPGSGTGGGGFGNVPYLGTVPPKRS